MRAVHLADAGTVRTRQEHPVKKWRLDRDRASFTTTKALGLMSWFLSADGGFQPHAKVSAEEDAETKIASANRS
jgi:hypothetical protein